MAALKDPLSGNLDRPGGVMLVMKGSFPEDELLALPPGWRLRAVHRLKVPGLRAERHLLEVHRDELADVLRRAEFDPNRMAVAAAAFIAAPVVIQRQRDSLGTPPKARAFTSFSSTTGMPSGLSSRPRMARPESGRS